MNASEHEVFSRPRWTLSEAARRTGTSRATLLRRIEAGKLPGATKTDNGWSIGVEDLLAAGFHPDRPSPPENFHSPVHEHVQPPNGAAHRIAELERDLSIARTQQAAAEQVAAERERTIEAQAMALRILEAKQPSTESSQEILGPRKDSTPRTTPALRSLRGMLRKLSP